MISSADKKTVSLSLAERTASDSPSATILIVDDQESILMLLDRALRRLGYNVRAVSDGHAALDLLERERIDLVLSDVDMPLLSGIDLLREIRERGRRVPVIVITGKPEIDAAVECIKVGAFDYVSKPFTLDRIDTVVRAALAGAPATSDISGSTTVMRQMPSFLVDYEIMDTLGEGNMGIVFLARKKIRGRYRSCAIKLYKAGEYNPEEFERAQKRFLQEAKALATVKHPNIVKILEFGLDEKARLHYIVMEYVRGKPLVAYLANPKLLEYGQKAKIIRQVAKALAAIHKLNICHRDIKPANIMVDDALRVKVTDFGIAKLPDSLLTHQSELMGSPAYMAPESFVSANVDSRADIFSLGIVAYELFLGQHPFSGDSTVQTWDRIRHHAPPDPRQVDPDLPPAIAHILDKMLQKNVHQRYGTASELQRDLGQFLAGYSTDQPSSAPTATAEPPSL